MKKIILLATICLPLLFGGCAKRIVDITATIYGYVRDVDTQKPLEGARITLAPSGEVTKTTGGSGYYEFTDIEAKGYTIQVHKEGYHIDVQSVNPTPGKTIQVDFALHKE